jgi:hypothetical protein
MWGVSMRDVVVAAVLLAGVALALTIGLGLVLG